MQATGIKVSSLDEVFAIVNQKIDPKSCQSKSQQKQLEQMKEYRERMYAESIESQLLLQLLLDSRPAIKKASYIEVMNCICQ